MQELTSSITDDQVIGFFMNKVSPHVLHYQKSAVFVQSSASDFMTSHDAVEGREAFVNRLGDKMEIVVQGMDTNTVKQNSRKLKKKKKKKNWAVAVARCLFTRGSNHRTLTGEKLRWSNLKHLLKIQSN